MKRGFTDEHRLTSPLFLVDDVEAFANMRPARGIDRAVALSELNPECRIDGPG